MSRIAIVILNWNGVDMLRRFLPSVVKHSPEGSVIVADNGSTDESVVWLTENYPQVQQTLLGKNYGFAEGYNRALGALGEGWDEGYYLLLNSDVEVPEGWLTPLLDYMDAHPEVAACQPKLRCQWNKEYFEYAGAAGGYIDRLGYPYCRGRVFGTVERDEGQYDTVRPVLWASGAALLIRSKDYWAVGGLDGRFFAHQEEIDLCWRLLARGRGVVCVPESVVYHFGGGTLPQGSPRKTFLNFRNNLLLLYKNLSDKRLRRVMHLRFWLDALASVQFLITGQGRSALAVWQARREFRRIRKDFEQDRCKNLTLATCDPLDEEPVGSLLWQYYAKGKRTWKQLCT